MIVNDILNNIFCGKVRTIKAKVELFNGSTFELKNIFSYNDDLISFEISRLGEGKFFGFGVSHKANIKIRDINRLYKPEAHDKVKIYFEDISLFCDMEISEVHRDEITNELSLTLYDALEKTNELVFSDLTAAETLTAKQLAELIVNKLGLASLSLENINDNSFNVEYLINFDESETLRTVLNSIAEVTQSIYFINYKNQLIFKRLSKDSEPLFSIDRNKYFSMDNNDNRRLQTIAKITDIGDNVSTSTTKIGSTQYIKNNSLWELREDISELLEAAKLAIGDLTINQFESEWMGNPLIEIGDKIFLETKDLKMVSSFLLNDTISYNGFLSEKTQWSFTEEDETASNESTIGEALNQTFGRVDKLNKKVTILASETAENADKISQIELDTDGIYTKVQQVEKTVNSNESEIDNIQANQEEVKNQITEINKSLTTKATAEDIQIEINKAISGGVESVKTTTGFTFNNEGLKIGKSNSEIDTVISENGMIVSKQGQAVLTANNQGVDAQNLHATTYLIIGSNARLEDYEMNRTGCFYITEVNFNG